MRDYGSDTFRREVAQKKRPFYHIVVADKRFARDGRRLERIGTF